MAGWAVILHVSDRGEDSGKRINHRLALLGNEPTFAIWYGRLCLSVWQLRRRLCQPAQHRCALRCANEWGVPEPSSAVCTLASLSFYHTKRLCAYWKPIAERACLRSQTAALGTT